MLSLKVGNFSTQEEETVRCVVHLPFIESPSFDDGQPEQVQLIEYQPCCLNSPRQPTK